MLAMRRIGIACLVGLALGGAPLAYAASENVPKSQAEQRQDRYHAAEAVLPQHIAELISDVAVRPIWEPKGSRFVYERKLGKGLEYHLVEPSARKVTRLLSSMQLETLKDDKDGVERVKLANLRWKADGVLEFEVGDQRWRLNLDRGNLTQVPTDSKFETESPDGKLRAFVRDNNLFVRSVLSGEETQLTNDGTIDRPYARPVVNPKRMVEQQTEFPQIAPDVEWSPDSKKLVTYQLDYTGARKLSMMQSTPPENAPPKSFEYFYTLSGDPHPPMATTLIFDVESRNRVQASLPPEPMLYYGGPDYLWTKDNRFVLTRRPERGYKRLSAIRIDAMSGESTTLAEDRSDTYVDYYGHFWSYEERNNSVFWLGDRDGFAHITVVDANGQNRQQLTSGNWRARTVLGLGNDGKTALIMGSGKEPDQDPYLRKLYSVSLKGGEPKLLTAEPLDHDVSVSPDGKYFVDNMSLINQPTRSVLRSTQDGRILFEISRADPTAYLAAGFTFPEPFQALATDGKTTLFGAIYKPRGFKASESYPIIENIYTGPHYVMTPKSFEAALFARNANSMAQLGAIGITIDGRGTWGRSRAFHEQAYGRLHSIGVDDHVAVLEQLSKRHSWFDINRVGVYGFSAGGYDVVRMMTERPDIYKVGVAASGNHDNRLDKAQWNEQWLGLDIGKIYDENSNVLWADKLKGKLFLAHGELDENVPLSATLRLVDRLIKNNNDFDFLVVPNADHYLDDSPYFHRKRFDFFTKNLIGAPFPEEYKMRSFQ